MYGKIQKKSITKVKKRVYHLEVKDDIEMAVIKIGNRFNRKK